MAFCKVPSREFAGTDEMLCCGVIAVIHGIIVLRIGEIYTINGDGFLKFEEKNDIIQIEMADISVCFKRQYRDLHIKKHNIFVQNSAGGG